MSALLGFIFVFVSLAAPGARAGDGSETEQRDAGAERGVISWVAERFSWLDWTRHNGDDESPAASMDPETQYEKLEPYYGCIVDSIAVTGNEHTKAIVILREMATKQGRVLDERLIRRDAAYIRGLGYFADVSIAAEGRESGGCLLRVTIVERPAVFMRAPYPVVNYDFQKGLSYGATWKIKNFRGLGEDLAVSGLMRKDRDEGLSISWSNPWFLGRRMPLRLASYAYRLIEDPVEPDEEYLKEQVGASIGFGLPLTGSLVKQLWLKPNLSFERRKTWLMFRDASGNYAGQFYLQNFVAIGGELEYDSRNDRLAPFNGMFHRFQLRRFSTVEGPERHYIFYGFSDYFYVPTGGFRSFVLGVNGDIREGNTPTYLEMKLGGVRDLRGFRDDALRGTVKLVATIQYRTRLIGTHVFHIPMIGTFDFAMNGVAFVDNGALMDDIRDIDKERFYTTGGLGLELISPFRDLLRLEMAVDETVSPAFYMTAGTDF
jgi:outer membrane protein assembly factor BamA